MKTYTYDEVLAAITEIVNESPDFVYHRPHPGYGCVYVHNDAPSCLVGHYVIRKLNVEPQWFLDVESRANDLGAPGLVDILEEKGIAKFTNKATCFLGIIQEFQDEGEPWGKALRQAIAVMDDWENEES